MDAELRKRIKRLAIIFAILGVIALGSCSALWPLAGSTSGAALGAAVGGPGGGALGAAAGYGAGEAMKGAQGDPAVSAIASAVEGLSPAEVRGLVDAAMGEHRGFFDGLMDELIALVKLCALVTGLFMLGHFLFTMKGQKEIKKLKDSWEE